MFYSTQDALKQGYAADPARRLFFLGLRKLLKRLTTEALDRKQYNLAAMFACQAQFCREAYDAENVMFMVDHIFSKYKE